MALQMEQSDLIFEPHLDGAADKCMGMAFKLSESFGIAAKTFAICFILLLVANLCR